TARGDHRCRGGCWSGGRVVLSAFENPGADLVHLGSRERLARGLRHLLTEARHRAQVLEQVAGVRAPRNDVTGAEASCFRTRTETRGVRAEIETRLREHGTVTATRVAAGLGEQGYDVVGVADRHRAATDPRRAGRNIDDLSTDGPRPGVGEHSL